MRWTTWFVTAVLGLVALAGCAGPAAQEAVPEIDIATSALTTSLERIEAEGYAWRGDDCRNQWLWFTAVEEEHDTGSGDTTIERFIVLDYNDHDYCEGRYDSWYGTVQLDAGALTMQGKLGSAELHAEADLTEGWYGPVEPVHLVLDVTLLGVGDSYTTKTKEQSDTWDGRYKTQTTSTYRYGEMNGTILVDGVRLGIDDPYATSATLRSLSTTTSYTGDKLPKPDRNVSIGGFYAWPYVVDEGEPGYLEWWVSGRDPITLTIEPDVGDVSGLSGVTVWPTETTTYTLTARNRWSEASAEATLYVRPPLPPDACEPNDGHDFATPWQDACVSTTLNLVPHDMDWFLVDLDQPSRVTADVDSNWDGLYGADATLGVFDEAAESLAIIDDWDGIDPYIEIDLAAGRYYVAVTGYGDLGDDWGFVGNHDQHGEYELRITVEPLETTVDAYVQGTYVHMFARGLGDPDEGSGTREIVFDVGWHESWRGPERPSWVAAEDNWDAVWVFAKFREVGGAWHHATLTEAFAPSGAAVDLPDDGRGVFLYRPDSGYGEPEHEGYFGADEVSLTWAYEADGVGADAVLEVRVFGIEMVYVPEGAFYAGSGGTGRGEFRAGGTAGDPFRVDAQGSIALGSSTGELDWTPEYDAGTPEGSTDPGFPTGFGAFYVMKYELTQGQYVDFLNTLTQEQANTRRFDAEGARFALEGDAVGDYWTNLPYVPLNFATWADGAAYADWAGLRPMTELEFEKVARGPLDPVADEYAWGSTTLWPAYGLVDEGTDFESPDPADANANVGVLWQSIRVGAFAAPGRTREESGAGYYGALDLTGNLWENVVTIGLPEGRAFTGLHGDGALAEWGDADVAEWPDPSARGAGFRGGNYRDDEVRARTSDRIDVAQEKAWHDDHHGWRGVRTAP